MKIEMSRKNKEPLSKAVGEWDNGSNNKDKIDITFQEVKKAISTDSRYKQMAEFNQLQLNLRGSSTKNSAGLYSDDIDIHCSFNMGVYLPDEKKRIEKVLSNYFSDGSVIHHMRSITIMPTKKRLKVDLVVCRQEQGLVVVWNDTTGKEEKFYPTLDQDKLGKRNDETNGRFLNMVRAFKTVKNLVCQEHEGEYHIPSFTIECMLFWVKKKTYKKVRDNNAEQDARKLFLAVEQSVKARLKNITELDKAKEINDIKPLFSDKDEYKKALCFWKDLHVYLVKRYDFET